MVTPALAARSVSVVRNGHDLLDEVSLSVAPGERALVYGPSGAGKTSLFEVLGLLTPPTAGEVLVDDTPTSDMSERERAQCRRDAIGFVFQDFQLIPDLTAWENVAVPQEHAGDRDEDWINELFDRLGIASVADQSPATLSGGEKQRVGIARALANRPAVVLADEPTGHLDPETAEQVLDLLLELQADARTSLVVVSHDPAIAETFSTRYRLVDGTVTNADTDAAQR